MLFRIGLPFEQSRKGKYFCIYRDTCWFNITVLSHTVANTGITFVGLETIQKDIHFGDYQLYFSVCTLYNIFEEEICMYIEKLACEYLTYNCRHHDCVNDTYVFKVKFHYTEANPMTLNKNIILIFYYASVFAVA